MVVDDDYTFVTLTNGTKLQGEELEEYCKRKGLCPLCAKTKIRTKKYKLFSKSKWEALTTTIMDDKQQQQQQEQEEGKETKYIVYKGYCLRPNCFTFDQALRLTGDYKKKKKKHKNKTTNYKQPEQAKQQQRSDESNNNHDDNNNNNNNSNNSYPPKELKQIFRNEEQHPKEDQHHYQQQPIISSIIEQTIQTLSLDTNIQILDLSFVAMRIIDMNVLSTALKTRKNHQTLTCLIFAHCQLDDEHMIHLGNGLVTATTTNTTTTTGTTLPLVTLSLRANQIGDSGMDAIHPFLEQCTSLQNLNISNNQVSSMGAISIFNALDKNRYTSIQQINLAQNLIWDLDDNDDEGQVHVGARSFLSNNTTIQVLSLEANYIGTEGVQSLTMGISRNTKQTTLEKLYLGFNRIGDDGAILLAQMLEENTTLKHLSVEKNDIGNSGARAFLAALETNETIQDIAGLWRNHIDRRFIIIAIRRLLLSHNNDHQQEEQDQQEQEQPTSQTHHNHHSTNKDGGAFTQNKETHSNVSTKVGGSTVSSAVVNGVGATTTMDRLTIFQSAPLAYFEKASNLHKGIPLQDFRHEASMITKALSHTTRTGSSIEVAVRMASVGEFSKFLQEKECRIMHFSGFGHPDYIAFENEYGLLHKVSIEEFFHLVTATDCILQVVIICSHNALTMGQAFVNAGIPHVVCLQREDVFRDDVTIEFTRTLYRELASMKTLKESFEEACRLMDLSTFAKQKRRLRERFRLLPQVKESDSFHNIPVFFTEKPPKSHCIITRERIPHLPKLSRTFLGREVDMFEILESLRVDDSIRISGPPGIGKDAVVSAACDYAMQRREAYMVDELFWLPPPKGIEVDQNSLYWDLCQCLKILTESTANVWEIDKVVLACRDRIDIDLKDKRSLLVVDEKRLDFKGKHAQSGFELFLTHLLNAPHTKLIKILATSDASSIISKSSNTSSRYSEETNIEINPLDFRSTALLFGLQAKFISSSGCPAAHSATEFAKIAEPPFITRTPNASNVVSRRRSELFARMGNGVPSATITAARNLSIDDFVELIKIANIPEVYVDSLGSIDHAIRQRSKEREVALHEKNYMRASNLDKQIMELEEMRTKFPTINDLRAEEAALKEELADAISKRSYEEANSIKKELLQLKKKIMKERSHSADHSNGAVERMDEVQAQIQSMLDCVKLDGQSLLSTFIIESLVGDCKLIIETGDVFSLNSSASGIVVWANESCELDSSPTHETLIGSGGQDLLDDIGRLPLLMETQYGPVRCSTGNAVAVGPKKYGDLGASVVILAVGPLSPNNLTDAIEDNTDTLHYIKVMLRSCYRSSLVLARHCQIEILALNLLTTRKTGRAYKETLLIGMKTLVEEIKFSSLRELRVIASSSSEATLLMGMMSEMGHRRS